MDGKQQLRREIRGQIKEEEALVNTKKDSAAESRLSLVPPFPSEAMLGLARDFVELYDHWESPPEYFYFSFMTWLGACCKNVVVENVRQGYDPPRLYVLLLGLTGSPRKSTAINETERFFASLYYKKGLPTRCRGVGSAEGLMRILLADGNVGLPMILIYDELSTFLSKCQIQSAVLLPMVNTLFESTSYENQTKEKANSIEDVHLSLLAASTLDTYDKTWADAFTNIGFDNRLFLVPGSPNKIVSAPGEIDSRLENSLRVKVIDVIKDVQQGKILRWDPDARVCFDDWYRDKYTLGSSERRYGVRLDSYARRLMKITCLSNGKSSIDVATTEEVLKIIDWQREVRKTVVPSSMENKWAKVEENIRRALGRGDLTKSRLRSICNTNFYGISVFERCLKNLESIGDIEQHPSKKRKNSFFYTLVKDKP
jgi:hypothetical protein